jgi:hypothetical protein
LAPDPQSSLTVLAPDADTRLVDLGEDQDAVGLPEELPPSLDLLPEPVKGFIDTGFDLSG